LIKRIGMPECGNRGSFAFENAPVLFETIRRNAHERLECQSDQLTIELTLREQR